MQFVRKLGKFRGEMPPPLHNIFLLLKMDGEIPPKQLTLYQTT
jgi:hypothetical protein